MSNRVKGKKNMKTRIGGLVMALVVVAGSLISMVFVGKIVSVGGAHYTWEYFSPIGMLCFGVALTFYWTFRIIVTRNSRP